MLRVTRFVIFVLFSIRMLMCKKHREYIEEAIEMAADNAVNFTGGPFGAIIVKDGKVIGKGANQVTTSKDPTAHAEIVAIRDACKNTDHFKLEGAVIYASCEPCPMCLSAIYWARIEKIYYAAKSNDAAEAGFDDSFIYREINLPNEKRSIPAEKLPSQIATKPFKEWIRMENKIEY